ncbi:DUF1330 domain-containing protein [Streptosporangium sp. NPDC000396]|uniref:DUF1330 domain-containing protein n=1 Tax=Streptosporangium sp. NPDC000396 TaxID=3366185 RepID=UPI003682FB7A
MPAYAVAHLHRTNLVPEVVEYLERIQATMDPFSGRFIVHGGPMEVREGTWPGALVVLEFPDMTRARAWYESAAYQEILALRTRNIEGDLILIEGVSEDHKATDVLGE